MTATTTSAPKLRLGVIVLTVVTAIVHLYLGISFGDPPFILNGLGYLALLAALYLPIPQLDPYRNVTRWILAGYTALTIVLWLVITGGFSTTVGYVDKMVEVLLIVLLVAEARASKGRRPTAES